MPVECGPPKPKRRYHSREKRKNAKLNEKNKIGDEQEINYARTWQRLVTELTCNLHIFLEHPHAPSSVESSLDATSESPCLPNCLLLQGPKRAGKVKKGRQKRKTPQGVFLCSCVWLLVPLTFLVTG